MRCASSLLYLVLALCCGQLGVLGADPRSYCEAPGLTYHPFPLDGFALVHVSEVVRHGDRTPVHYMLQGEDRVEWQCANVESVVESALGGTNGVLVAPTLAKNNVFSTRLWNGTCDVGQLTLQGVKQHMAMGARVRKVYHDTLRLLPDVLDDPQLVYVRATDYARTRQSAVAHLAGVFPASTRTKDTQTLPLVVYPSQVETMIPSDACPRLTKLVDARFETAEWKQHLSKHSALLDKMNRIAGRAWVRLYEPFDGLHSRLCHNMPMPCWAGECITDADLATIHEAGDYEMNYQYDTHDIARISVGVFMHELRDLMVTALNTHGLFHLLFLISSCTALMFVFVVGEP